jgi:CubicO group peptidase (beta-lactamase class C family)
MKSTSGRLRRLILIAAIAAAALSIVFIIRGYRSGLKLPDPGSISSTPYRTISGYAPAIEEAREIFLALAAEFPGASISVGVGRDVVWSEGAGYADIAGATPVSPGTRFRIYSLSKTITGAAAAALSAQGLLDLDVSVRDYLPSLPDHYGRVTSRQLLGHLSGVRHYRRGEWMEVSAGSCVTPSDALDVFAGDPLVYAPGDSLSYSSYGYVLLSAVIESASGTGFERFVSEKICKPAWMHNTEIEDHGARSTSVFYEPVWGGRVKEARSLSNACRWGAGGFLSTADDLVQFCLALLGGKIVTGDELDEVFCPMKNAAGQETGYAFGWGVGEDDEGRRYASHSGGAIGGRSALYLLREEKIAVAILANMDGERFVGKAARIAGIFARHAESN